MKQDAESASRKPNITVTKKDLVVETFRAGGPGGQHQNKTETGVRVTHPPSGAVGEARDSRSQADNKKAAFLRMTEDPKFQLWIKGEQIDHEQIKETIRTYNFNRNEVKDHRTGKKADLARILDGHLEDLL